MDKTLIVYSSNRDISHEFMFCLFSCIELGAGLVSQTGCADVALARNLALSKARKVKDRDIVLMVDDDIVWTPQDAQELINHVRNTGRSASGCYVGVDGKLTATKQANGYWATGLGFLAFNLAKLYGPGDIFTSSAGEWFPYCKSGGVDGEFLGEDYYFTRGWLGDVDLLPVGVGHVKTRILMPAPRERLEEYIGSVK